MESKSRKMKFTDLKDMLKQTGEVYGNRPAYIFRDNGKTTTRIKNSFRLILQQRHESKRNRREVKPQSNGCFQKNEANF